MKIELTIKHFLKLDQLSTDYKENKFTHKQRITRKHSTKQLQKFVKNKKQL